MKKYDKELIAIRDAAIFLGVSTRTIQAWIREGRVKIAHRDAQGQKFLKLSDLVRLPGPDDPLFKD